MSLFFIGTLECPTKVIEHAPLFPELQSPRESIKQVIETCYAIK